MPRRHCSGALYEVAEAPEDDKRRAPLRSHHLADGRGWCRKLPIYPNVMVRPQVDRAAGRPYVASSSAKPAGHPSRRSRRRAARPCGAMGRMLSTVAGRRGLQSATRPNASSRRFSVGASRPSAPLRRDRTSRPSATTTISRRGSGAADSRRPRTRPAGLFPVVLGYLVCERSVLVRLAPRRPARACRAARRPFRSSSSCRSDAFLSSSPISAVNTVQPIVASWSVAPSHSASVSGSTETAGPATARSLSRVRALRLASRSAPHPRAPTARSS